MSHRRTPIRPALALALVATALTPGVASAAAGDLDPSFGTGGKKALPGTEQPLDVFVQPDGKIVSVGGSNSLFPSFNGFLVRRLLPDGSPDKSFDKDGTAVAKFTTVPTSDGPSASGAALQPDGGIVVAGNAGTSSIAVARFASDGSLDKTFDEGGADGDGKAVINNNTFFGYGVSDVVLQPSGRIVLIGSQGNDSDFAALRLRSDGSPDGTTFDPGDFADNSDTAIAATPSGEGTTTLVGTTSPTSGPDVTGVVRYKSDGKLDTTLAGSGKTTVASIDFATAAIAQPDGKLLVAGSSGEFGSRKAVITRLTREGNVDTTFGSAGSAESQDDDQDIVPNSIALQPDGKIVVSGQAGGTAENATYEGLVARFDSAGRPDPSFGSGGRTTISFGEIGLGGPAALQPDGKVVVVGYGLGNSILPRPVVARLQGDPSPAPAAPDGGGGESSTPQPQPQPQQEPGVVTNPADTVAPRLRGLRALPDRRGRLNVRFTLSEAANVRFTLQRVPRTGRPRAVRGSFSIAAKPGTTRIDIARRSIVRRLAPGSYRLVATPTDAAGNRGTSTRATFRKRAR